MMFLMNPALVVNVAVLSGVQGVEPLGKENVSVR